MDDADFADGIEGRIKALNIRAAQKAAESVSRLNPAGRCINCGRWCGIDRRWCSVECRDDWESWQEALQRKSVIG